jgi:hypothetical protein
MNALSETLMLAIIFHLDRQYLKHNNDGDNERYHETQAVILPL